jgi:hypothetical protein
MMVSGMGCENLAGQTHALANKGLQLLVRGGVVAIHMQFPGRLDVIILLRPRETNWVAMVRINAVSGRLAAS